MKNKQTILSLLVAICMLFGMGIALSGCGELPENELDLTANTKVYDGEAINVAAIAKDDADIKIEFKSANADDETYSTTAPKNVGTYVVRVKVGETDEYKAIQVTREFQITPKEVEVEWTAPENLIYSKSAKVPTIEITSGIVAGDECEVAAELKSENDNVNVGSFKFTASLNNNNYKIAESQVESDEYTITAKGVTLNWPNEDYTYNKTAHLPTVTISSGLIEDDECHVLEAVMYDGDNVNAGNFYCGATLSNANYTISGQTEKVYSIYRANYGYLRQRYKRPDSDSWSVSNFKVGETLYCEAYTDADDEFEGEVYFTLYSDNHLVQTGDAIIEGNLLTATKYGTVWLQAHVRESRNYNYKEAAGVQTIYIEGLICVEGEQYEVPTGITGKYGQTLEDVYLPAGFTWKTPTDLVGDIGENVHKATFTPSGNDANIYLPKQNIDVTVVVGKGDPDYVVPTELTGKYGNYLSSVKLPDGFEWTMPGLTLGGIIGQQASYTATYTPSDTEHYNVVTNIVIKVLIQKGDQVITVLHDHKNFDGDAISDSDLGVTFYGDGEVTIEYKLASDPDTAYSTVAPNAAHEYSVRITVSEGTNYLGAVIVVSFTIVLE